MKRIFPWFLWVSSIGLVGASLFFQFLKEGEINLPNFNLGFAYLILAGVAGFINYRQPRNRIGWILLASNFLSSLTLFSIEYSAYSLVFRPGSLPFTPAIYWFSLWTWLPSLSLFFVLLPLVFPTGRPLSSRWRVVIWVVIIFMILFSLYKALAPVPSSDPPPLAANPLGIAFLGEVLPYYLSDLVIMPLVALSWISLALRYFRSKGEERAQLKWFLFAVSLTLVNVGRSIFVNFPAEVNTFLFALNITFIAVAIGIAVLRYHLYDIDVIIRRTLVYGSLTAVLALLYFGGVVFFQEIFQAVTGQDTPIAIVLSTLAIAALFNPLRKRVQDFVDRRFYRRKYDAEQALASFAALARQEVDLDEIGARLLSLVEETVQPEHASLWIKPVAGGAKR